MSRSLAFTLAAILLVTAASAQAQSAVEKPAATHVSEELHDRAEALRQRVRTGLDTGQISNDEASRALRELRGIRNDDDALRARNSDRLPESDRTKLEARLDRVGREIHWRSPQGGAAASAGVAGLWSLQRREHWLDQRISRALVDGSITSDEARRAREELTDIRYQDQRLRASHDGRLAERDLTRLQDRLDRLIQEIHWSRDTDEHRPW